MQQFGKYSLVLVVSLFGLAVQSQTVWQDNFADSNFTTNPAWGGDTALFIINGQKQLQLDAPAVSSSVQLQTTSEAGILSTWQFYIRMDFNPSSNNYAKVFLMSNSSNFNQALAGYYLRIGGSSADRISLFRQDGNQATLLAESADDIIDQADVQLNMRVTRDSNFTWEVAIDTALNHTFVPIFSASESTYLNSSFFGVQCVYTSTRSDKFYFDDFVVDGQKFVDSIPPVLVNTSFPSVTEIDMQFSEPLDSSEAANRFNYVLLGDGVNPTQAEWTSSRPASVTLQFADPFVNGQQILLRVEGLEDTFGNEMADTTVALEFYRPEYRSIVFNEIMADPEPMVGLPTAEYLELYNASGRTIELASWQLVLDDDTVELPSYVLPPTEYVLIISSVHIPLFDTLPHIALPLGSSWLRNSGEQLLLMDENNQTIDALAYSEDWYQNSAKAEGGWSLEQIDADLPCSEPMNWSASKNNNGGTPAKPNNPKMDLIISTNELKAVYWVNDTQIRLVFTHALEPENLPTISSQLQTATRFDPTIPNHLTVSFSTPIPLSPTDLFIETTSTNCFSPVVADTFLLSKPAQLGENDIVLNELLFNPKSGGTDFIELWNTSDKTINLNNLRIASLDENNQVSDVYTCGESNQLLLPKSFLVLSEEKSLVCGFYSCGKARLFNDTEIPSMPDDEGAIALVEANQNILERVRYSDDWHHLSISNTNGVSLERISPNLNATEELSWHSAASRVNFATPGAMNSQFNASSASNARFTLSAETISPNNDGFRDILSIDYRLPEGSQLTARVFSLNGVAIATLVNNELMQTEGTVIWNGKTDQQQIAPTGIYVLLFEWFTASGESGQSKLTVTLSQ